MKPFFLTNYKKNWFSILFCFFITILFYWVFHQTGLRDIEYKTIDLRFRTFADASLADSSVVMVAIDDTSLEEFSQNGISWPWPRDFYALALDYLSGSKAVVFDLLFYEPDLDRSESVAVYTDSLFAEAISKNKNVILAGKLTNDTKKVSSLVSSFDVNIPNSIKKKQTYPSALLPIEKFLQATNSLGIINITPDSDGVVRRIPYFYQLKKTILPQMGVSIASRNNQNFSIKNLPSKNEHFIDWYGNGGPEKTFPYLPFVSIIQSSIAESTNDLPVIDRSFFQDKIVIIGSIASGVEDNIATPMSSIYPGMELWATIYSNLIKNHQVVTWQNWVYVLLVFLFLLIAYRLFGIQNIFSKQLLFLLFIVSYTLLSLFLWNWKRIYLPLVFPILTFLFSFVFLIIMSYFSEGKAKRQIQKVFSRYLHPDVISELMLEPEAVKLGGKELQATILFTDIANFTTFSEGKNAPELIHILNSYFSDLTNFVLQHQGLLDKYTGDGIMAIFGAPLTREDNALSACKAALAHKTFAKNLPPDNITSFLHQNTRIGINSGKIVAGNLGSHLRMDYTAIGDDVNLAARLEGVNKLYKTKIMISKQTYEMIKSTIICRELDTVTVKGKSEPTILFEVIAEKSKIDSYGWVKTFNLAMSKYKQKNWVEAKRLWEQVIELNPDDFPTKLFLSRCAKLIKENPPDWNCIINLTSK